MIDNCKRDWSFGGLLFLSHKLGMLGVRQLRPLVAMARYAPKVRRKMWGESFDDVDVAIFGQTYDDFLPMYISFFKLIGVHIPFSDFQIDILNFLKLCPSQLHPNIWALF